jgi:hypothetical protein
MAETIAAQSIGRSQAKLLASGFLDSLGSKPEISDLILSESLAALIQLAGGLIIDANENLSSSGHVASGALSDSHKIRNPYYLGSEIRLDIEALFYFQFLNRGVRGTQSGTGEFAFKSSYPSRAMVAAIAAWINRAGLSSYNVKKSVSNQEVKNKTISHYDKAYAVARSIKMKGIRPTGYFDRAIASTQTRAADELGKAFKIDLITALPNKF